MEIASGLAELFAAALALSEPDDLTERTHWHRGTRLAEPRIFDSFDLYVEVFDAYDPESEGLTGALWDDLADVYGDVSQGLETLDLDDASADDNLRDAVWHWRFSFFAHWGEHATSAIRALYWALRRMGDDDGGTESDDGDAT